MLTSRTLIGAVIVASVWAIPLPRAHAEAAPPATEAAASAATDLSGEWQARIGNAANPHLTQLRLDRDGAGYKGVYTTSDGQQFPVTATLEDGLLVMRATYGDGPNGATEHIFRLKADGAGWTGPITGPDQAVTVMRLVRVGAASNPSAKSGMEGSWLLTTQGRNNANANPNRRMERELVLKHDGAAWTGVLKAPKNLPANAAGQPWAQDRELKEVTVNGEEISFVMEFARNGQPTPRTYKGKLVGDALEGTIEGETGGNSANGLRSWKATRMKEDAGIVGEWRFSITAPDKTYPAVITFRKEGDGFAGQYAGGSGPIAVKDMLVEGNNVRFTVDAPVDGQTMHVAFNGTLNGDTLQGYVTAPDGMAPFKAQRSPAATEGASTASPVGEWDLTIKTPDRTYTPTMAFKKEADGYSAQYGGPGGNMAAKDVSVDPAGVKWTVDLSVNGNTMHLAFSGAVTGDTMTGVVKTEQGDASFTGKRKKSTP